MKYFFTGIFNRFIKTKVFTNFVHLSAIQVSNVLLQILFFPIVLRIVGINEFGYVTVFSSYATLAGMIINYGTRQSGVTEVAISRNHPQQLSESFFTIFSVRFILLFLYILLNITLIALNIPHVIYLTLAGSIVLAEAINPLFFFLGMEKLILYNFLNILSKAVTIILILLFVKNGQQAPWINFFIGTANCIVYLILLLIAIKKYNIKYYLPPLAVVYKYLKHNFYLLGNNLTVQLQQSFFLFMLLATGNSLILGAYSVGDRVIWSCRLLLISIADSVFSKGAVIYRESTEKWKKYKKQLTLFTGCIFLAGSLFLLVFPEIIIKILTEKEDELTILYLRSMAFAPFIASLNAFNVLELLFKGDNKRIFLIGLTLLIISVTFTTALVAAGVSLLYGYYSTLIDLIALLLYTYFINKNYPKRVINLYKGISQ